MHRLRSIVGDWSKIPCPERRLVEGSILDFLGFARGVAGRRAVQFRAGAIVKKPPACPDAWGGKAKTVGLSRGLNTSSSDAVRNAAKYFEDVPAMERRKHCAARSSPELRRLLSSTQFRSSSRNDGSFNHAAHAVDAAAARNSA